MDITFLTYKLEKLLSKPNNSRYQEERKAHSDAELEKLIEIGHETIFELSDTVIWKFIEKAYTQQYRILPFVNEIMDRFSHSILDIQSEIEKTPLNSFYILNQLIWEDETLMKEPDFCSFAQLLLKKINLETLIKDKDFSKKELVVHQESLKFLVNLYGKEFLTEETQSNFYTIAAFFQTDIDSFKWLEKENIEIQENILGFSPFDIYFINYMEQDDFLRNSQKTKALDYLFEKENHTYTTKKPYLMSLLIQHSLFDAIEYLERKNFDYSKPTYLYYINEIDDKINQLNIGQKDYKNNLDFFNTFKSKIEQNMLDSQIKDEVKIVKKIKI